MSQRPLPTVDETFQRTLTGATGSVLRWSISSGTPYPGAARLDYLEGRDGTITISAISVHPSLARRGLQRAVLASLAAHHPSHLWWRLAPDLTAEATGRSATFWARVAEDHTVGLADVHGRRLAVPA